MFVLALADPPDLEASQYRPIGVQFKSKIINFSALVCRWFKFTIEPPYTIMSRHLLSAIWDMSHWTSFVKFVLETA